MSAEVQVQFLGQIGEEIGTKEVYLRVSSELHKAIGDLELALGVSLRDQLGKQWTILVNGRNYLLIMADGGRLQDGDCLVFVPFLGGG